MPGIDSDRFVKVCHRSVDISDRGLRNSTVVISHDITRVAFERLIEVGQGAIHVAFTKSKISPVVKGRRQARNNIERTRVIRNGLGKLAASFISETAIEVSRSEIRCELKGDVVGPDSSVEVSVMGELVTEIEIGSCCFLACFSRYIPHRTRETQCKRKSCEKYRFP